MSRRIEFIDGLRALAAASVVVQHVFESTAANDVFKVLSPGLFGVVLFFFISGFIIPYSVGDKLDLDKFAVGRIFRIFPAYLVVFGASLIVALWGGPGYEMVSSHVQNGFWLLANALTIADYTGQPALLGVAWTLPMEYAWYGIFAVLFALFGNRFGIKLSLALCSVLLVMSIVAVHLGVRIPLGRLSLVTAASIGYLAYLWKVGEISQRVLVVSALACALITGAAFVIFYSAMPHPNVALSNMLVSWGTAFLLFGTVLIFPRLSESRVLVNPVAAFLGKISYSLYLVHGLIFALLFSVGISFGIEVLLGAVLCILVSYGLYKFVERPGMAAGRKVSQAMQLRGLKLLSRLDPRTARVD
jgi:peptidoglycan/LPS O-acetylase OafA/YrhL